jgi:CubicO group peptidase (beta-lactamase class C family)
VPSIDSVAWYDSTYATAFYQLDTFFTNRFEHNEFNGNVMIAKNGRIIYSKSFGYTNPWQKQSLRMEFSFQLASITKPFTATAVLQLCKAGKLSLADTITKYIPKFPYPDITVQHLLSHRSGLPEYFHFTERLTKGNIPEKLYNDSIINLMIKKQPRKEYPPDFKYDYCNTNYIILAHLIEKASGKRYCDYMYDSIFKPLGMKNTFVCDMYSMDSIPNYALCGYEDSVDVDYTTLNEVMGDKGIYSTCNDLLCFDQALRSGKILDAQWQEKAYTGMHDELDSSGNYGLGWRTIKYNNNHIVYHAGWWKGFRTLFLRDLTRGLTAVILTNIRKGPYVGVWDILNMFYEPDKTDIYLN